ncbi:unnamed protein product, partial [Porites evermanni]
MKPLPPLHREPREQRSPATLEALVLLDVPNPGEATQENLPPCHSVRIKLEAHEFEESRQESKQEHQKKFRQTLHAIRSLPLCRYTDWVFNNEDCQCNVRLGIMRLLIDDFINDREFNPL